MKVLTLHQPWATLIALGVKTIETRGRSTSVRGRIAIHAAARPSNTEADFRFDPILHEHGMCFVDVPRGAIVATVTLTDCVPIIHIAQAIAGDVSWPNIQMNGRDSASYGNADSSDVRALDDQLPYGDFRPGRFAWLLDDIQPVTRAAPFKGGQGWSRTWEPAVRS